MCTVTWVHGRDGYELFFNRDEAQSRGAERPAEAGELRGVRYLAPADSDFGGTWILVNELGVTACLLNAYGAGEGPPPERPTSRGRLVRELADARSVEEGLARLEDAALEDYRPFSLLLVEPGHPAALLDWDGARHVRRAPDGERPLVSSGVDVAEVRRRRRALYDRVAPAGEPDAASLALFHASHEDPVAGEGPSAYTPCMHRADAETRSLVHIRVSAVEACMDHVRGAPCRASETTRVALRRRPLSADARAHA